MTVQKILIVGATGTIGQAVVQALQGHELIQVGRTRGDLQVNITSDDSVQQLFAATGAVDAIISTTGSLHFGPLHSTTPAQFNTGLQDKLLGQVRLALIGQHHLRAGGSITLTSGILAHTPVAQGSNASAVNAALEGFAKGAAVELGQGRRINVVSPTVLTESLPAYGPFFPGFESVPAARVAQAYVRSVLGVQTGEVFTVW